MTFPAALSALALAATLAVAGGADLLTPLARAPDWSRLEVFQETITRGDFERLLAVYAPQGFEQGEISITTQAALVSRGSETAEVFTLRFADSAEAARPIPRPWKPAAALPTPPVDKPLAGTKIAIDPGHLGGQWARMEERWFQIGETVPVTEGDMTLLVARHLATRLRALGAKVSLTRSWSGPATNKRPSDFEDDAHVSLAARGVPLASESAVRREAEKLFYRVSEIRHRANDLNHRIQPDLVVALHFNAEAWGNPAAPTLVEKNHLHLLVNGCYSPAELAYDDVRFEMLLKLLTRCADEALPAAESVATAMAAATGLPPYLYPGTNACRAGKTGYVWTRNLLASRLFLAPVVYLEPYVMNSRDVFERVQLGDYEGEKLVAGKMRPSIYREYANSVTVGLAAYYRDARTPAEGTSR